MAKKLLVSTRKGLLIFSKKHQGWKTEQVHFNGIPISLSFYHPFQEALWVFQKHGHWGMKVQRS